MTETTATVTRARDGRVVMTVGCGDNAIMGTVEKTLKPSGLDWTGAKSGDRAAVGRGARTARVRPSYIVNSTTRVCM